MINNRAYWPILGFTLIGIVIISLIGITLSEVLVDELAENGLGGLYLLQTNFSYDKSWTESKADEFSGVTTAWLFGLSIIPVGVDLISRAIIRYVPFGELIKKITQRINITQKKYLMPLHTYLSILALGLGILHLTLSSCVGNPLPEASLFLLGILVTTGLLCKWNSVPNSIRKILNKFHASLIVSGVILIVLLTGHIVMDMD